MILRDLHTHTVYSDGADTPEEMVKAAIAMGLSQLGISDHSYTSSDTSYCMQKEDIERYFAELSALKEKYKDKIELLIGIEQDYYADFPADKYDYSIGSVHYITAEGDMCDTDLNAETLKAFAEKHFGGDIYAVIERYFETVGDVINKTGADIIGHFDLISKCNEKTPFFDEQHPRYKAAWKAAADRLLKTGKPFEINTGAISRGYKTKPYPSDEIYAYLKERGASFIKSSDAHSKEDICFCFEKLLNK